MSAVAAVAFPASSPSDQQGTQLGTLSTSGQQINESSNGVSNSESVRHRIAHDAYEGGTEGSDSENLNVATAAQDENTPGDPPWDGASRISISTARTGSTLLQLSKTVTNTIEKSRRLHRVIALLSTVAILITIIGFFPSFMQYYYTKIAWDQGVQLSNQTSAGQEFDRKTAFYNTCQLNRVSNYVAFLTSTKLCRNVALFLCEYQILTVRKMINNTVEDSACEEALQHPAPTLPFPYMANPVMNKFKRQILEAICTCDCSRNPQTLDPSHDDLNVHVTIPPTDTGALDVVLLFFMVLTAAVIFLLRKRLSIARGVSALFNKNAEDPSPWIFRPGRQTNPPDKIRGAGQGSGISHNAAARRRGINLKDQKKQTLWQAAASGNMNVVQEQLGSGLFPDINKVNSRYGTPLCAACEGGDIRIATILMIRGADVNVSGGRFTVPIQAAAYSGNTTLVQFLLAKGSRVDICGGWSETALQAACERGDVEMVQALLDAGAAVNAGGGSLGFPLQAASARGRVDIASLLIRRGADVNAEGGEYGCALNAAVACGSTELVDLLLKNDALVDLPPGDYGNCVQIALRQGFPALAKSLIEKGANGDVADEQRRTPLIEAAILGDIELVTRLLDGGVDLNIQDEDKWSALHYVALEGKEEIAKLLIEKKANVMLRDKWGAPALHRAAGNGHLAIVELLLNYGADINAKDVLGATALHQAAAIQEPVLRLLLARGADPSIATSMGETALHSAVNANNLSIVRALLDAGSDTSTQDNDQATALFRSVNKGFYQIARELLERGAAANARSSNVLQEAIAKGEISLVALMIDKGASVNAQGYVSWSRIYYLQY